MRVRFLFAFLALVVASAHAQQPVASETIDVRLLEIEVVVTDRAGKPVHGLTPGDFELSENGRVQQITNLSEYRDTHAGAAAATPAPPEAERAPTDPGPRMLVLLLDPIVLLGEDRAEFFGSLRGLVEGVVRNGDKVQIRQWAYSGFKTIGEPALDRAAALDALTKLERELAISPHKGPSIEERIAYLQESKQHSKQNDPATRAEVASQIRSEGRILADEDFAEMRRKTASMQRVVSSLRGASGRRSVIVYASSRFPRLGGGHNTAPMIASVIATANANGIAFYTVRPGRLPDTKAEQELLQNEIEALTPLAVQTGGTVGTGAVGVRAVLERIASDLGSYYSLGWHARSDGSDRERRVRVRAKNPELLVRARTTLIEKSDRTRAADQLIARLFERGDGGDVEFEVTVGKAGSTGRKTTSIPVTLTIPADQLKFVERAGAATARFTVLAVAGDALGNTTTVTSDTREVAAPARADAPDGNIRYDFQIAAPRTRGSVSIGVFDENSGLLGVRRIDLSGGQGTVAEIAPVVSDAWWRDASERAVREGKPLVVFFRTKRCRDCDAFERNVLAHPAIARRTPNVVFTSTIVAGGKSPLWTSAEPGLAVFDETQEMRAKWTGVPDATQLGMILDAAIAAHPDFKRAAAVARTGRPWAETSDLATGLVKLGRPREARAALDEAVAKAAPADRQTAAITLATLDAREGKFDQALASLGGIIADARTPDVAAQAWLATGFLRVARNETDAARLAFRAAIDAADETSPVRQAARQNLQQLATTHSGQNVVRIIPFSTQIVSGWQTVLTAITSAAVARVTFTLDNEQTITATNPPFSANLQFSRVPQAQTVRATAYDRAGAELGRDELRANDGGEVFWVRVTEPQAGNVKGSVPVQVALRAPAARTARHVVISWNDRPVATLTAAPWRAAIDIPAEMGVLKAVIELDDGQTAEDAVVLNAGGYTARSEVQMVDLPITVAGDGAVNSADVVVREGKARRSIEALTAGVDAPLTVGILIDSSSSMQKALPDVQEAAIRFVDSLGTADRAFVVAFDSTARMLEAPTSDRARIRAALLSLRPAGFTALYDAMVLGLLQFEGVKGRRALVVFTDGLDVTSGYGADDVEALARRSNVPIYLVTPPLPQARIPRISTENRAIPGTVSSSSRPSEFLETRLAKEAARLAAAAKDSGGDLFEFSRLEQVGSAFVKIAESLQAQWILTIRTDSAAKENEWRAIDVSVRNRRVRAPSGYYAPH